MAGYKFIKCIDDGCTSEYANLFEKLEHNEHYSPYDKLKDKYIKYTLEEFIELLNRDNTEYYNYPNSNNDAFEYDVYKEKDGLYDF